MRDSTKVFLKIRYGSEFIENLQHLDGYSYLRSTIMTLDADSSPPSVGRIIANLWAIYNGRYDRLPRRADGYPDGRCRDVKYFNAIWGFGKGNALQCLHDIERLFKEAHKDDLIDVMSEFVVAA